VSRRAALAGVACLLVLGACDSDRRAISRDDLPEVSAEPAQVVEVDDRGFDADSIEVRTDELVQFVNAGDEEHGVRTGDARIDTGLLLPGETTYVVFDEARRYDLVDVADRDHTLTVIATEPAPGGG
jgi:plastocyanin